MSGEPRLGRNDPCPCGSGKKYKRCCLSSVEAKDFLARRLRHAEGELALDILDYAGKRYGEGLLGEAWAEFTFAVEKPGDPREHPEFETSFLPWFLYNWVQDPHAKGKAPGARPEKALALEYMEQGGRRLSDLENRFVNECCRQAYSFYAITDVNRGRGLTLKNVMSHRTYEVVEREGSKTAERGCLLYARIVGVDGVAIMCGCGPLLIPPSYHNSLIDLRERLTGSSEPVTEEVVHDYDSELREAYFSIADRICNPRLPELRNTDGEPLVNMKLRFDLRCPPREAFERLKELSVGQTDAELIDDASYDAGGDLGSVRFSWTKTGNEMHKEWKNTVMGSLAIEGRRLVAEVNSKQRGQRIRDEIEGRLGDSVVFKGAVIESVEKALANRLARPETVKARRIKEESERLGSLPEVQEQLKAMMAAHWESWLDERIPTLGDQTPREAAKTPAGRERLEALLEEYGWYASREPGSPLTPPIAVLKTQLGL